jgi:hypothetical protein
VQQQQRAQVGLQCSQARARQTLPRRLAQARLPEVYLQHLQVALVLHLRHHRAAALYQQLRMVPGWLLPLLLVLFFCNTIINDHVIMYLMRHAFLFDVCLLDHSRDFCL